MANEWPVVTLGELIENKEAFLQTGPFGTALKAAEYSKSGVPLISVREIREGYIHIGNETPRVDEHTTKRLPKFVLRKGDIVFGRKGGVERNALITEAENGWFLGSDGIFLRLQNVEDAEFISYVMRSSATKTWLLQHCEGTTMPSLNQKILSRLPVFYPSSSVKKKVSNVLGQLDKKIQLNRQTNQTLEAMAQALFKSWFVDFDPVIDNALAAGHEIPEPLQARAEQRKALLADDASPERVQPLPTSIRQLFPNRFVRDAEMGWIPEGWESTVVGHTFDMTMGQSPPGSTYNEAGEGLPFFQGKADFGFRFPSNRVYCSAPKRLAEKGQTLISVRAPVGTANIAAMGCSIGRGVAAVQHKSGSTSFTYYAMRQMAALFEKFNGEGTVFGSINKKDFNALPHLEPASSVVSAFTNIARPMDDKIETNTCGINELSKLRDTLLPKLISGELRLPDATQAEQQLEAVSV